MAIGNGDGEDEPGVGAPPRLVLPRGAQRRIGAVAERGLGVC